jgi:hypothetical protein
MIIASQSSHTLDVLAIAATVLAAAAALLTVVTVLLGMHLLRRETRNSAHTLSEVMRVLSKRGVEHAHRVAESKHMRH